MDDPNQGNHFEMGFQRMNIKEGVEGMMFSAEMQLEP